MIKAHKHGSARKTELLEIVQRVADAYSLPSHAILRHGMVHEARRQASADLHAAGATWKETAEFLGWADHAQALRQARRAVRNAPKKGNG